MIELILARFFKRNVDALIRQLDKLETKLAALAERKLQDALLDDAAADDLRVSAQAKRDEAERAARIANRVGDLTQ